MLSILAVLTIAVPDTGTVYRGDQQQLDVPVSPLDGSVTIDGRLDEDVWGRAARLTGFSQYSPVDGRGAEEPTEVRVWYSASAIHFGIVAHAAPGTVRAHLADRDRGIIPDDYIELHLGTFNDGRQVFVFGVNPLGVQADGTLIEGNQVRNRGQGGGGGGGGDGAGGREQADLSPDFVWDSKGLLTETGYQVEVRIPFKSLRYQRAVRQDWTFQVIRKSAAAGREDTWAPATRGAASFVAQAGRLVGISGIKRGMSLEVNPIVTSSVDGLRDADRSWSYHGGAPEPGGNVRLGVTSDLTLNGTVNPDFSQVEADAGQISPDPRSALFFQEKRPFFLDGIEYFSTPTQIIYTRRVVAPVIAAKFTGRVGRTNLGLLTALDDRSATTTGARPFYNLLRFQRDVGRQSRIGLAYTDRVVGSDYNRVLGFDSRFLFGGVYSLTANVGASRTRTAGITTTAPVWSVGFNRSARTFGFNLTARGIDPKFEAQSGFVSRGDLAQLTASPSWVFYGRRGALVERVTLSASLDRSFIYDDLFAGRRALERKQRVAATFVLRSGWSVGVSVLPEVFSADPRLYADYAVEVPTVGGGRDTIPYSRLNLPDIRNLDFGLNLTTPQLRGFDLTGFVLVGRDENFFEWSPASLAFGRIAMGFRPTERLRFDGSLAFKTFTRVSDRTSVGSTWIPRLKVEYQVSRAIFVRAVGEYTADRRDDLRDDGRTNAPILIRDDTGIYQRGLAMGYSDNRFRVDWLFSYQPTPGTVFFAGYGSSLAEPESFRFKGLTRSTDGFFTKLSYLFRL